MTNPLEKKQNNVATKENAALPSASLETTKHIEEQHAQDGFDDSDMVVIEEDRYPDPNSTNSTVAAVRLGDYSRLFARLRRGG